MWQIVRAVVENTSVWFSELDFVSILDVENLQNSAWGAAVERREKETPVLRGTLYQLLVVEI